MADKYSIDGGTYTIQSWDGGRLNTKAHGPGTLVESSGVTRQCTLDQGVISGYCWVTTADGRKWAQVYNTQGMKHGTMVAFRTSGDIYLVVRNNGKLEGCFGGNRGMMCIQYM